MFTDSEMNLLADKRWRMNNLYKIQDKNGQIVTFKFNSEQAELFDAFQSKKASGDEYGLREQILKDRQIGISTFMCLYDLDEVAWNKGRTAAIIAHEREALEKIFRKVKLAWESMPEPLRPPASMENKRELQFKELNSNIYIALNVRSGTVHHLHISEMAYIKKQHELKAGSFQAVPKGGDITIETTGNGFNQFYKDWLAGKNSRLWRNHFFDWRQHTEYVSSIKSDRNDHDDYLVDCTQNQRNWWYAKLEELGDLSLMKQEYPLNEDDAFMQSGHGVFDEDIKDVGILEPLSGLNSGLYPHLLETDWDYITIYKEPVEGAKYCAGVDSSGGYADGDNSAGYFYDSRTWEIVARFHGTIAPDMLGHMIVRLAKCYNNAFLGIEVNNHGLTTINEIKYEYSDLYQRERRDKVTDEITLEVGWVTTRKSKAEMIDSLKKALRSGDIKVIPVELMTELKTFVRKGNGEMEAEEGCTDDEVMAAAIGVMMVRHNPHFEIKEQESRFMGRKQNLNRRTIRWKR